MLRQKRHFDTLVNSRLYYFYPEFETAIGLVSFFDGCDLVDAYTLPCQLLIAIVESVESYENISKSKKTCVCLKCKLYNCQNKFVGFARIHSDSRFLYQNYTDFKNNFTRDENDYRIRKDYFEKPAKRTGYYKHIANSILECDFDFIDYKYNANDDNKKDIKNESLKNNTKELEEKLNEIDRKIKFMEHRIECLEFSNEQARLKEEVDSFVKKIK